MRIRLYSVKDRLLGVFLAPFAARADVEAKRQIVNSLKDPQMQGSSIVQSPKDFDLCYVATMEDETGEVFPESHAGGAQAPIVVDNLARLMEAVNVQALEASRTSNGS